VSTALANFLFEAANFLVLAAALGWILFRPVWRALEGERERQSAEEAEATRKREEAARLLAEASEMRGGLEQELEKRRSELLAEARREAHRVREDARNQQAAEIRKINTEMKSARAVQVRELAGPLGRIAGTSVESLLKTLDGPSLDAALVRAACRELSGMPEAGRQEARVEVARPLEEEARRMLGEVLGENFKEQVVDDLGAGVRVTTSAGQVDASAPALARQAAEQVTAAMISEATAAAPDDDE
jgi:F0F1-type ATP synthase membrane subunit b/b'